jgi:hypothetical protein
VCSSELDVDDAEAEEVERAGEEEEKEEVV